MVATGGGLPLLVDFLVVELVATPFLGCFVGSPVGMGSFST